MTADDIVDKFKRLSGGGLVVIEDLNWIHTDADGKQHKCVLVRRYYSGDRLTIHIENPDSTLGYIELEKEDWNITTIAEERIRKIKNI